MYKINLFAIILMIVSCNNIDSYVDGSNGADTLVLPSKYNVTYKVIDCVEDRISDTIDFELQMDKSDSNIFEYHYILNDTLSEIFSFTSNKKTFKFHSSNYDSFFKTDSFKLLLDDSMRTLHKFERINPGTDGELFIIMSEKYGQIARSYYYSGLVLVLDNFNEISLFQDLFMNLIDTTNSNWEIDSSILHHTVKNLPKVIEVEIEDS